VDYAALETKNRQVHEHVAALAGKVSSGSDVKDDLDELQAVVQDFIFRIDSGMLNWGV